MRAFSLGLMLFALVTGCRFLPDWLGAPTATPIADTPCAWQWANQGRPEISASLQAAIDQAGLTGTTLIAYAFGEDCINRDGSVRYFATMEIDYRLSVPLSQLAPALEVLLDEIAHDRAGSRPGRIELEVDSSGEVVRFNVPSAQAAEAIAQGLTGDALLAALRGS